MTHTTRWLKAAAAAASTLFLASCYYDPYAGGGGYGGGGGYDGGGGYYGGGGSGLNTTFIYTSSDRWLYDPAVYCYYDRHQRRYYDPYLYGYYPVGYCPRPIYGGHHPHGWNGHGHLPPPSNFRDRILPNYQNRIDQLKASNYSWAQKVRERNDATSEAWRNQRTRAAANFQQARANQADRNRQMRDNQSQRQQNIRSQQQNWADKVREQRQGNQRQGANTPAALYQQRQQAQPSFGGQQASGRGNAQARMAEARAQQQATNQARIQERQTRQAERKESSGGGQGGGAWKQKMQERRDARGN